MIDLPPPRDLPPHRHTRMRAAIVSAVDEPPRRRWVAPLATATGLTAAVAVAVWIVPTERAAPVGTATQPGITTTSTPLTNAPSSGFPGLSSEQVRAMERGCALSALGSDATPSTPGISDTPETVRLRNLLDDDAGRLALIVGNGLMVHCDVDAGGHYNGGFASFGSGRDDEPGAVTLDLATSSAGERALGRRGARVVAGRVLDDRIARVTVASDGRSADAVVANGTYLVRFVYPVDWAPTGLADVRVTAYDADGTVVASVIT
ncbi:hypothetical protein [Actinokineospora sp. UTMC 2448]|uniref:hypothetical protein n=1 Tax=Actinokineospora sp. UTMC 2448 TaxID=2268449 RepID=UPI002164DA33|nr:hypothetical protein [Actinokineospora sp. UTMC 2448]UVS77146.1 hypothetical protein Actkin_00848 [Actinokineospora sp. UTMC 2448]